LINTFEIGLGILNILYLDEDIALMKCAKFSPTVAAFKMPDFKQINNQEMFL
jgi:hypothetical protein